MLENLHIVLQVSAGEFGLDFKVDSSLASLDHSEVDGIVLVPIDESKNNWTTSLFSLEGQSLISRLGIFQSVMVIVRFKRCANRAK